MSEPPFMVVYNCGERGFLPHDHEAEGCPSRRYVDVDALRKAAATVEVWTTVWQDEIVDDKGTTQRMPTSYAREASEVVQMALDALDASPATH